MSNGIEMVCEMASEDSDWPVSFPHPIGMAFERLKLSPHVTTLVVEIPFQLAGGNETGQAQSSLTISNINSIPFDMAKVVASILLYYS
jgi:hypothetical protein